MSQKNELKPWQKSMWCIPPQHNAEFVFHMENVLEAYQRPYDPRFPLICMDELSKQLTLETQTPLPARPGRPECCDYEYVRNGTANMFAFTEPLTGWRHIAVTDQRTRIGEESGPATQLGLGVVAGDEIWDPYSRIRLRLGPLRSPQYQRFLPGGDCHDPLAELVRLFVNDQFEIEVQLVLAAEDVRGCGLGTDPAHPPRLGWDTWIRTGRRMLDGEETILAL